MYSLYKISKSNFFKIASKFTKLISVREGCDYVVVKLNIVDYNYIVETLGDVLTQI